MNYTMKPVAYVRGARREVEDDQWGGLASRIELAEDVSEECLWGLDTFSHAEVLFVFDRVADAAIVTGARHPRNNAAWPKVGIFAQRAKNRPNRIGSTIVPIVRVDGRTLHVAELDAVEGTPVLDIKPVLREFLPRTDVRQPAWASELMDRYWAVGGGAAAGGKFPRH